MQDRTYAEAIRIAEKIKLRTFAVSGASVAISAAAEQGSISSTEILQVLDALADDLRRQADDLLAALIAQTD